MWPCKTHRRGALVERESPERVMSKWGRGFHKSIRSDETLRERSASNVQEYSIRTVADIAQGGQSSRLI